MKQKIHACGCFNVIIDISITKVGITQLEVVYIIHVSELALITYNEYRCIQKKLEVVDIIHVIEFALNPNKQTNI